MAFHPTLSSFGRIFLWPVIRFCEFLGTHYPPRFGAATLLGKIQA